MIKKIFIIIGMLLSSNIPLQATQDSTPLAFHHHTVVTFLAVQQIREFVYAVLTTFNTQKLKIGPDPREVCPMPNAAYKQTRQGLRIYFNEDGLPDELATPWGLIELCGIYQLNGFDENDAQELLQQLQQRLKLVSAKRNSYDIRALDDEELPKTILLSPHDFVSPEEIQQQWQMLSDWFESSDTLR